MKIINYFIFVFFFAIVSPALARGYLTDAAVISVTANVNNRGVVKFDKPTNFECPNGHDAGSHESLVFDLSTDGGKVAFSVALTAKAANLTVSAAGSATCTLMGDMENGQYIKLQ